MCIQGDFNSHGLGIVSHFVSTWSGLQLSWWNYAFNKLVSSGVSGLEESLNTAELHATGFLKEQHTSSLA